MANTTTHRYRVFEHFLTYRVTNEVGNILAAYQEARGAFKEHITRVITEANKFSAYLRREYDKAVKRGLTDSKKQPDGYQWFVCSDGEWTDIYFDSPNVAPGFWIKGKPKPNPLDYLRSMVWGRLSRKPPNLSHLDYQYLLTACINDFELQQIYFFLRAEDLGLWDKELKDRICRRVWTVLTKGQKSLDEVDMVRDNILEAIKAIRRDLHPESKAQWSSPMNLTKWGKVYNRHRNTMRTWFKSQMIPNMKVSDRLYRVNISGLPAELVAKIRDVQRQK